ncbi:cytochrome c-type protein NapC [Desulfonauticus submarinus]|uniref:Cytochrome c-type protein n=1 Tax=Desulfonauticus submarinus TaxID=206665 RepID=A0A1H0FXJ1_9BACT|nr:NapC/NirT family cytochrome c [Desulfonauticus submarinus]SDN99330.1 cytochrome c-type protein NapC [Desulfonauticus submarinus]
MRILLKIILLFFLIVGIGFPLFSMTYYTMVRTSTPKFCSSCHEIEWAYDTWKSSAHAFNSKGVVADCMDCHLPAPHDTWSFFFAKTYHGLKDIIIHLSYDDPIKEYNHEENRKKVYATMKNEQCQKCHRNLLYLSNNRGAMLAHRSVLYPRKGYEKRCVDCHQNLVHKQRSFFVLNKM